MHLQFITLRRRQPNTLSGRVAGCCQQRRFHRRGFSYYRPVRTTVGDDTDRGDGPDRTKEPPQSYASAQAVNIQPVNLRIRHEHIANVCREVERVISYHFNDPEYLIAALRAGETRVGKQQLSKCRQHLAIIGDAALRLIYFSENFPTLKPDKLFKEFGIFGSNEHLVRIATKVGLHRVLEIEGKRVIATTVEAIWGAVFKDSGKDLSAVKCAIDSMLAAEYEMDASLAPPLPYLAAAETQQHAQQHCYPSATNSP